MTIRAVRVTTPLRIDDVQNEALYTSVPPISDFVQFALKPVPPPPKN